MESNIKKLEWSRSPKNNSVFTLSIAANDGAKISLSTPKLEKYQEMRYWGHL